MKGLFQRILQEIMKKNNKWNIRRLVDDLVVPSSKRPSVLYYKLTDFWKSERDRGDEKSNCTTFFRNSKWLRQKITYVSFASMSLNNHYSISYLGWYKMCANLLLWRAADAHCLEKWKFVQKLCILKHKKSPKNLKFYRCSIYTLQSLWYFNM